MVGYGRPGFERNDLGDGCAFFSGHLPSCLLPDTETFDKLWANHPAEYHVISIHGRQVPTPRWQQAYGMDYHYTGQINRARSVPDSLEDYLRWAKTTVDERLNGMLLNWYDGELGHYIGRHRDSTKNMVVGAPIVTISLGEERIFRLRPWPPVRGSRRLDFRARNGTVFVMPFETNLAWTHEVPASKRAAGRRISVTLRAFQ
jgi:alkylated DNA repair dioxygenase AlkB